MNRNRKQVASKCPVNGCKEKLPSNSGTAFCPSCLERLPKRMQDELRLLIDHSPHGQDTQFYIEGCLAELHSQQLV